MHFAALELDFSIGKGEESIIAADADVKTRAELGAALADDDRAGGDDLSAVGFNASVLRIAVASIAGGTRAFLMCHASP